MIGDAGFLPFLMSRSSLTDSLPQPKYFCPSSTWTLPSRSRSSAGLMVSNEITFVFDGSTLASALRVNTGQPPTEIHAREIGVAARSGGDDLRAANHVFLDVVGLDDLDARRLRQRFLHAVRAGSAGWWRRGW